jgi:hypothetical protein
MTAAVVFVTAHAITRYQERVEPGASRQEALRAIREILQHACSRSRPRLWTKVKTRPGYRYLYSADHPGVCLVVRGRAVVTVFSRSSCAAWDLFPDGGGTAWSSTPYHRPAPTTWRTWEAM